MKKRFFRKNSLFKNLCAKEFSWSLITNSMTDIQNSEWPTKNGGCKVRKFCIFF